jgi:hypothetical protein
LFRMDHLLSGQWGDIGIMELCSKNS